MILCIITFAAAAATTAAAATDVASATITHAARVISISSSSSVSSQGTISQCIQLIIINAAACPVNQVGHVIFKEVSIIVISIRAAAAVVAAAAVCFQDRHLL
jgi:hypothetical protein